MRCTFWALFGAYAVHGSTQNHRKKRVVGELSNEEIQEILQLTARPVDTCNGSWDNDTHQKIKTAIDKRDMAPCSETQPLVWLSKNAASEAAKIVMDEAEDSHKDTEEDYGTLLGEKAPDIYKIIFGIKRTELLAKLMKRMDKNWASSILKQLNVDACAEKIEESDLENVLDSLAAGYNSKIPDTGKKNYLVALARLLKYWMTCADDLEGDLETITKKEENQLDSLINLATSKSEPDAYENDDKENVSQHDISQYPFDRLWPGTGRSMAAGNLGPGTGTNTGTGSNPVNRNNRNSDTNSAGRLPEETRPGTQRTENIQKILYDFHGDSTGHKDDDDEFVIEHGDEDNDDKNPGNEERNDDGESELSIPANELPPGEEEVVKYLTRKNMAGCTADSLIKELGSIFKPDLTNPNCPRKKIVWFGRSAALTIVNELHKQSLEWDEKEYTKKIADLATELHRDLMTSSAMLAATLFSRFDEKKGMVFDSNTFSALCQKPVEQPSIEVGALLDKAAGSPGESGNYVLAVMRMLNALKVCSGSEKYNEPNSPIPKPGYQLKLSEAEWASISIGYIPDGEPEDRDKDPGSLTEFHWTPKKSSPETSSVVTTDRPPMFKSEESHDDEGTVTNQKLSTSEGRPIQKIVSSNDNKLTSNPNKGAEIRRSDSQGTNQTGKNSQKNKNRNKKKKSNNDNGNAVTSGTATTSNTETVTPANGASVESTYRNTAAVTSDTSVTAGAGTQETQAVVDLADGSKQREGKKSAQELWERFRLTLAQQKAQHGPDDAKIQAERERQMQMNDKCADLAIQNVNRWAAGEKLSNKCPEGATLVWLRKDQAEAILQAVATKIGTEKIKDEDIANVAKSVLKKLPGMRKYDNSNQESLKNLCENLKTAPDRLGILNKLIANNKDENYLAILAKILLRMERCGSLSLTQTKPVSVISADELPAPVTSNTPVTPKAGTPAGEVAEQVLQAGVVPAVRSPVTTVTAKTGTPALSQVTAPSVAGSINHDTVETKGNDEWTDEDNEVAEWLLQKDKNKCADELIQNVNRWAAGEELSNKCPEGATLVWLRKDQAEAILKAVATKIGEGEIKDEVIAKVAKDAFNSLPIMVKGAAQLAIKSNPERALKQNALKDLCQNLKTAADWLTSLEKLFKKNVDENYLPSLVQILWWMKNCGSGSSKLSPVKTLGEYGSELLPVRNAAQLRVMYYGKPVIKAHVDSILSNGIQKVAESLEAKQSHATTQTSPTPSTAPSVVNEQSSILTQHEASEQDVMEAEDKAAVTLGEKEIADGLKADPQTAIDPHVVERHPNGSGVSSLEAKESHATTETSSTLSKEASVVNDKSSYLKNEQIAGAQQQIEKKDVTQHSSDEGEEQRSENIPPRTEDSLEDGSKIVIRNADGTTESMEALNIPSLGMTLHRRATVVKDIQSLYDGLSKLGSLTVEAAARIALLSALADLSSRTSQNTVSVGDGVRDCDVMIRIVMDELKQFSEVSVVGQQVLVEGPAVDGSQVQKPSVENRNAPTEQVATTTKV